MTILIIGAGLSGCVLAQNYAEKGKHVLIIEKRDHIAGNCYDYRDKNGILVNKYGPHIFHTKSERVWNYVNRFSKWVPWKHRVYGKYKNHTFPVPINIETVNEICGTNLQSEEEMRTYLESRRSEQEDFTNSETLGRSRFGNELYTAIIEGYTMKQWDKHPSELNASVVSRIPIRYSFEEGYFNDPYQALPEKGYTEFCRNMLDHPNIEVQLSTEFSKEFLEKNQFELVFYTGPIDLYFKEKGFPMLEYRSLRFEHETINRPFFQETSQVNYTDQSVPYTRIIEYKHFLHQVSEKTTIVKEYSSKEGEPYYPIPSKRNLDLYNEYKELAKQEEEKGIYFVGRLANYKYFNMDEAILNALELFDNLNPTTVDV
jgi:UDP-galactopyranose mutase